MHRKQNTTADVHNERQDAGPSDANAASAHVGAPPATDDHPTDPPRLDPTGEPAASAASTEAGDDGGHASASGTAEGNGEREQAIRGADLPGDAQPPKTRSRPRSNLHNPILNHNPPQSTSSLSGPSLLMPHHIKPLLYCQCCHPPALLQAPTTLHCGHTVCSSHVRSHSPPPVASTSSAPPPLPELPTCPLPSCSRSPHRQGPAAFSIPSSSRVIYRPADSSTPVEPPTNKVIKVSDPKVDVVVSKVIGVTERMERLDMEGGEEFVQTLEEDSSDEEEEEEDPPRSRSHSPRASSGRRERSSSPPTPSRRPRKRRRHLLDSDPQAQQHSNVPAPSGSTSSAESLSAKLEKELMAELTCEICYTLLYQPVTTPCQHTFCAKCLQRSLDHNNACPLCRQDLPPFHYFQDHPYNQVLLAIILKTFPETYAERGRTIEEEEKAARLDTPLFVCQLSFPGMPTLLHIFEPRYRLMLRRCLSSATPLFGMIMPPRSSSANGGQTEYGTMLEVRSVQMLPDGRSMVETWGVWRFRILERAIVDGYLVGRIERIDDFEEELEGVDGVDLESYGGAASTSRVAAPRADLGSSPTNEELMAVCHGFLDQLRHGTAPWVVQRLNNTYGPMPTTASEFSFWMALVLPIDEHEKAKLLPIRSPRLRLRLVVHWIEQLNSNWYAGPFYSVFGVWVVPVVVVFIGMCLFTGGWGFLGGSRVGV